MSLDIHPGIGKVIGEAVPFQAHGRRSECADQRRQPKKRKKGHCGRTKQARPAPQLPASLEIGRENPVCPGQGVTHDEAAIRSTPAKG